MSQSQIKYEFDYALEYEITGEKDPTHNRRVIYYISSQAYDYFMSVKEIDSTTYDLYVRDNRLFTLIIHISKNKFNKADVINNNCKGVTKWDRERHRKFSKRYVFETCKDTILGEKQLSHYKIKALPKSRGVKDKSAYIYFIVNESIKDLLPIFEAPLEYEIWQRDKPFLNGLIEEYGGYSKKNGLFKYKLINVKKVKKALQIPENCIQLN